MVLGCSIMIPSMKSFLLMRNMWNWGKLMGESPKFIVQAMDKGKISGV